MSKSIAVIERKTKERAAKQAKRDAEMDPLYFRSQGLLDEFKWRKEDFIRDIWALIQGLYRGEIEVLQVESFEGSPVPSTVSPLNQSDFPPAPWVYLDGLKSGQPVTNSDRHWSRVYACDKLNSMIGYLIADNHIDLKNYPDQLNTADKWFTFLFKIWRKLMPGEILPNRMQFKQCFGTWEEVFENPTPNDLQILLQKELGDFEILKSFGRKLV